MKVCISKLILILSLIIAISLRKRVKFGSVHKYYEYNTIATCPRSEENIMGKFHISDCAEIYDLGHKMSGVYYIQPYAAAPVRVLCEMTLTEGWTVLLYR